MAETTFGVPLLDMYASSETYFSPFSPNLTTSESNYQW
jgi:hypothetical protein